VEQKGVDATGPFISSLIEGDLIWLDMGMDHDCQWAIKHVL
jgi:hypothetical protein